MSYHFSLRSALAPLALALGLMGTLAVASSASAAERDPAAEAFVANIADQAITVLKNDDKSAREAGFSTLLNSNADMEKIAAFCLGQFLRTPTPAQKAEYLDLFKKFVVKIYVTRLADYSNEKVDVTGSTTGKQILINSQINFPDNQPPVKVTWWVIKKDGGYKVFDLNVVGVWLAQEQRSSFTSTISNAGGDFNALLSDLKTKIADADAGKLPPVASQQ